MALSFTKILFAMSHSVLLTQAAAAEEVTGFIVWLRSTLGPPLKSIQQPIDEWLGTLPMSIAMFFCIGLFVTALIWVWCLKRDFIFRGASGQEWWRDLRLWATLVVVPYIAVYLWWGR